jgi:hypothetical protein
LAAAAVHFRNCPAIVEKIINDEQPAIPPIYEKVFFNTAFLMGESELVNQMMPDLPTDRTAGILVESIKAMVTSLREVDLVYRYGGEEFFVLLPETDAGSAVIAAERVRKWVKGHILRHRTDESVTLKTRYLSEYPPSVKRIVNSRRC